jgi:hypothetical protein
MKKNKTNKIQKENTMRRISTNLIATLVITLTFLFTACETQSPFETQDHASANYDAQANVNNKKVKAVDPVEVSAEEASAFESYKLSGEVTIEYNKIVGVYESGRIELADKSSLKIKEGSLVPPSVIKYKKPVTITMEMARTAENEVNFTFGPHGTQFTEPAEIIISYESLEKSDVKLYYIEDNGSYQEQNPDQIDVKNKKMYLYVDHFSRYAVAYGR